VAPETDVHEKLKLVAALDIKLPLDGAVLLAQPGIAGDGGGLVPPSFLLQELRISNNDSM
jgi:hypothetical protein